MATAPDSVVVVGDVLLDRDLDGTVTRLCPDAPVPVLDDPTEYPRPGGAGLAALLAAWDGFDVTLVTALGKGPVAERLRALLAPHVRLVELPRDGEPAEKTRLLADGRALLRVDRPGRGAVGPASSGVRAAFAQAAAILVSDYGGGVTGTPAVRDAIALRAGRVPVVWDPHPRGSEPVPGTRVVTPNLGEAAKAAGVSPPSRGPGLLREVARLAGELRERWDAGAVCVTLGAGGAVLSRGAEPFTVPAPPVRTGDPCGAGDRFAASVCGLLAAGRTMPEAVEGAVHAAADFLAAGGVSRVGHLLAEACAADGPPSAAAHGTRPASARRRGHADPGTADSAKSAGRSPRKPVRFDAVAPRDPAPGNSGRDSPGRPSTPIAVGTAGRGPNAGRRAETTASVAAGPTVDALELVRRARARGGTIVATGGCFDLLHAGHIRTLQAARALGDFLVVCLNSDASVRALKGPPRPFHSAEDRAEVLRALACVDAVAVFEEETPERLIGTLRPHVWVKGGDYAAEALPEAALVASLGGQVVTVPYLAGRSTTRIARVAADGG
ncbi:D-glycero-beta-D-manno-heptose 1-phosphate adenylyltransferase [Yinghuangia sp. YIM S10712]|uniref:D-glycero-beta-D-manno-heptose 1-phosphate adenylyltransferase n=1 Tax=Yinghuangia sp. YIM S10712 TaxID=3436930 RepID=UPI003F53C4A3